MLIAKNEVMNLTAITEFEEVVQKHFIDSVMIKEVRELGDNEKWIDVGTGAGFPGIPLKIVYPQLQVTLLDSLNKRVKFLQEVVDALGLEQDLFAECYRSDDRTEAVAAFLEKRPHRPYRNRDGK